MSEDQDRDSRTEEPTEKRLRDTIEKGNVPFSREVPNFLSLAAVLAACSLLVPYVVQRLTFALQGGLLEVGTTRIEQRNDFYAVLNPLAVEVAAAVAPALAILMVAGMLGSLLQNPIQFNMQRLEPKFSRLSPREGLRRIFGVKGMVELAKSIFKFAAVGAVIYVVIKGHVPDMLSAMVRPAQQLPSLMLQLTIALVAAITVVSLILAGVDVLWSRFSWRRDLRMTKQELKEEHRQAEGDPMVKQRFRLLARQRASRRMMAQVPKATLVVANPTHYAVAIRYEPDKDAAPLVLAKGLDAVALKIRTLAEDNDVPVIENKPLARALYEKAEVDAMIPHEFFRAVAEIIHVLNMKRALAR